jgi:hypothetical protein
LPLPHIPRFARPASRPASSSPCTPNNGSCLESTVSFLFNHLSYVMTGRFRAICLLQVRTPLRAAAYVRDLDLLLQREKGDLGNARIPHLVLCPLLLSQSGSKDVYEPAPARRDCCKRLGAAGNGSRL